MSGAPGGQGASGLLAAAMWQYAATVFEPTQKLKRLGLWKREPIGERPVDPPRPGLGAKFSLAYPKPVLLEQRSEHQHLVEEFDRMAEIYDAYVERFSRPIFEEALCEIDRYLTPESRVLDAGCGAGRELQVMARRVPRGEVVGIDLSAGMVNSAARSARAHGLTNVSFFQSDVANLPSAFEGAFDLVYSSLAHHHYPDPPAAAAAIYRCLRPGGVYCVVDPGPAWFNRMSAPLARWADPGWISFHDPEAFRRLFAGAGFVRTGFIEVLPGFGVALGQTPGS